MLVFLLVFITLLGLCIGSFLNVLIYRIPNEIPFWKGRSFCPCCKEPIKWYDNIPIISFIILRGKCRKCKEKISYIYPLTESMTGIIFFLIAFFTLAFDQSFTWNPTLSWQNILKTVLYLMLFSSLITLSFIDFNTLEIPDRFILFQIILSPIFFLFDDIIWWERLIGLAAASLPLLLLFILTRGNGIGFGDIKLMFSVGIILGWKLSLLALAIGFVVGGIFGVILLIRKQADGKTEMCFGPFLSFGILISVLFGNPLISLMFPFI